MGDADLLLRVMINDDGRLATEEHEAVVHDAAAAHGATAHCEIDEPPGWLCRDTPASMSYCNLGHREPMPGGWTLHLSGMVTEVSLLSPGREPYEPGAKVWHILDDAPSKQPSKNPVPAVKVASDSTSAGAGEVIHGGRIIRRNIGHVTHVGGVPVEQLRDNSVE